MTAGLVAATLWGCANGEKSPQASDSQRVDLATPEEASSADRVFELRVNDAKRIEADPPRGIDAEAVRPLEGEALVRARLGLPVIRAMLVLPEGLREIESGGPESPDSADSPEPQDDPSLQTQRLFAAALQQGLQGQGSQAIRLLEAAIQQTPEEPTLLRRLALGWAGLGNRVRAAAYFRQAVAANPDDLESVVALGRLLAESGDVETGTASLLYALAREDALRAIDPALPAVTRFYASAGLRRAGFTRASADLLDSFLDAQPPENLRPTRYGAELMFLRRRGPVHEVARGDGQAQLGDFRAARLAYERARRQGASGDDLVRRIVFADLWLGRLDEATDQVLEAIAADPGSPATLGMIEYLIEQGVPAEPIIAGLRALPVDGGEPDAPTLALASALPRDAATELLGETLDETPAADRVYDKLLNVLLTSEASSTDDRTHAITRAAAAIDADPMRAARFAGALLAAADNLDAVNQAFAELDADLRDRPSMQTLEAVVLMELGDITEAQARLDAALTSERPPMLARIEKARLLAVSGQFAESQAMLETIDANAADPRLGQLRVAVLLELGRVDEAVVLLDELIAEQPGDVRFGVQKSRVLVRQERFVDAEQTLLDVINTNPRAETAYAALLELYDRYGGELPDHPQGYQRLIRRMLTTIPRSRIARLTNAGIAEVRGQHDQAERLLDGLLKENPQDRDALMVLLDVYAKTDRVPQADTIVDRLLDAQPQDPEVLRAAISHYRRTRNEVGLAEVEERWLRTQEPSLGRDLGLARLLFRQGQADAALKLLDTAAADAEPAQRFRIRLFEVQALREVPLEVAEPRLRDLVMDDAKEEDLRKAAAYTLANRYESVGRHDATDALFDALLEALPDDAELKNHVGYVWAYAARNLDRAEALITEAIEADKDQSAYLDSMGWVRYKRGDFRGAERWLRRAMMAPGGDNPVILDHLGDVLYRLGQIDEAKAMWRQAREGMSGPGNVGTGDPETDSVVDRTTAKLDAAELGGDAAVPVSPLGAGVAVGAGEAAEVEDASRPSDDAAIP